MNNTGPLALPLSSPSLSLVGVGETRINTTKAFAKGRVPLVRHPETHIHLFAMEGMLPDEDYLVLNSNLGTLLYMAKDEDGHVVPFHEQQFTNNEMSVLLPLLENYPYHCPYEVLYASFYNGVVTDTTIALAREQLEEAKGQDIWDEQMRPIRNVLSRVRLKTRLLHVEISSILETGYVLRYRV